MTGQIRDPSQGVQIRTSSEVVHLLITLHKRRRNGEIGRRWFLKKWGELRAVLAKTPEYKKLRAKVVARAGGQCQAMFCTSRGEVMDHIEPVAMAPERALDESNCRWICRACHAAKHPHLQRR